MNKIRIGHFIVILEVKVKRSVVVILEVKVKRLVIAILEVKVKRSYGQ